MFAIQFAVSLVAVGLLVALAAWARIPRPTTPLTEADARAWFAEEFPDQPPDQIRLAADGRGAIARAGDQALVLAQVGDVYVARSLAWDEAEAVAPTAGLLTFKFAEPATPRLTLRMDEAAWPLAVA